MSSKIDGVPRELLEDFLNHRDNGDWYDGVWITHLDRLRALLAAPVVERQPFTWMRIDVDGKPYRCRAEDHGDSFPVYRAPPELAELQAKYDQLLEAFEQGQSNWVEGMATIARLTAENERLKGGQGEPVITILQPDPYDERGGSWMSSQDLRKLENLPAGTKLYASQPAPVSVVLSERMQRTAGLTPLVESHIDGWNACLDKVKEMNR